MNKLINITQKLFNKRQVETLIFLGGTQSNFQSDTTKNAALILDYTDILLSKVQLNERVAIARINTNRSTRNYLHRLGLKPGKTVNIVSKTASNSVVLAIENRQIGLGAKLTSQIAVTLLK